MKSAVKKNYYGDYILLSTDESHDSKYADKEKYRFIFNYSSGSTRTTTYSDGLSSSSTYKRFYVRDRLTGKTYQSGAEFTYFAKAMKVYMANLEEKRIANN